MLNKEFKPKDVNRLRDLIAGKGTKRTSVGVGYSKADEFHKEGDIWEENDKKWTIKDGIKQNITILDDAKKGIILPLFCPQCKNLMKSQNDKLFYIQYSQCFECRIKFETNLKATGKWDEYEKSIINSDIDNTIKEFEIYMDEQINQGENSYIAENGDIESWVGSIKDKLLETKKETIEYLEKLKK